MNISKKTFMQIIRGYVSEYNEGERSLDNVVDEIENFVIGFSLSEKLNIDDVKGELVYGFIRTQ